jgi:ribosome-associated translation inhibitor RaiA
MAILEMTFRGIEKSESIESLIREKAAKLEQVCSDLISCRIAVEIPQQHQRAGSPFRVRIDLGVPGRELVVTKESSKGDMHDPLSKILRDAFNAARRKLREVAKRRQGEVKTHPEQETMAYVYKLLPEEGYGSNALDELMKS